MKKKYLFFVIALLFASCTVEDNGINSKIVNLEVGNNNWNVSTDADGLNRYYYSDFEMPEITPAVYSQGTVLTYIVIDGAQQLLPYVRHYEDISGAMWTRTVDFDYTVDGMSIYVTNSDFFNEVPPSMSFRVVIMW